MLKFFKRNAKGKEVLFEEDPKNENLDLTAGNVKTILEENSDIVFRELYISSNKERVVTFCYVDGLIDFQTVSNYILKPLQQEQSLANVNLREIINLIEHGALYYSSQFTRYNLNDTINDILKGYAVLIFDEIHTAVTFDTQGLEKRSIDEPKEEGVIKGPKEAFIEVLRVNTSLVRRKIKTQNLKIKELEIGMQTKTNVAICYIDGIIKPDLVEELLNRLKRINTDSVLTTADIEENIIDNRFSTFPQMVTTERCDKFCSNILEGRAGIIIDGLPITFIVPGTINQFLQAPEDYSRNFLVASLISIIRYVSLVITLLLPGFYVSITSFHQEMIPTDLTVAIISSKEGVPFPVFIEVYLMLLSFEVLLEAGLRIPKAVGSAVTIVGALIVGQAAVEAKMASPAVVIIVAITVIAGFTMPNQDFGNAIRVWRFILTSFAIVSGLFGLSVGLLVLLIHLAKMETFGVAYLTPFVANEGKGITKDTILRLPVWLMKYRPRSMQSINKKRKGE